MHYEKHLKLVQKLIEKTAKGSLTWNESLDPDTFQVSFPDYTLRIHKDQTTKRHLYTIGILNGSGNEVEAFSSVDLEDAAEFSYEDSPTLIIEKLFLKAKRSALRSEEAIDDILNELEQV